MDGIGWLVFPTDFDCLKMGNRFSPLVESVNPTVLVIASTFETCYVHFPRFCFPILFEAE